MFETLSLTCSSAPVPLRDAIRKIPASYLVDGTQVHLDDYAKDRNLTALLVLKDREIIHEKYLQETNSSDLRISCSVSKSIMSMLLGCLLDKGIVPLDALETNVAELVPQLKGTGYDGATLTHVLNMASGVNFNEDYMDYHSDINRMGRVLSVGGSLDEFATTLQRRWQPGRYMHYVSIDTHVLGMVMRAVSGTKIIDLLQEHIFDPIGLETPGYFLTDTKGEPFILGGLNLTTRDYARLALVAADYGNWHGRQIISTDWMEKSTLQSAPPSDPETAETPAGTRGYGMQWWLPPNAEPGEFCAGGIYGQFLYIHRGLGVVIVQNAADTNFREGDGIVGIKSMALFRAIAKSL